MMISGGKPSAHPVPPAMRFQIIDAIERFVREFQNQKAVCTRWRVPLVGFAAAADALFPALQQAVRPSHAMPRDLLPSARSVVAYFLPFAKDVTLSNRKGDHASAQWASAYVDTNRLIVALNASLADFLAQNGFRTVVLPPTHNFLPAELVSDWSHKHVAYIAGLGKFGRHHLLITEKGCCGRFGSIVTEALLPPSERPEGEFCLYRSGTAPCSQCVQKCAAGALTEDGFDRRRCYDMLLENAGVHQ